MSDFNSSYIEVRQDILKYIVGENNVVLDVGCATGKNGKFLLDNKIATKVYGIEFNGEMATKAQLNNTHVFQGDLNLIEFRNQIISELPQFDYILFGDVLEHLYDPQIILKELTKKLKPNGQIIISLPNIGHIELFIQIYIKGSWPSNDRGIFDKTHLRWFTKKDAVNLVNLADLKVIEYERNLRARDAIGSKFNWKTKLLKLISKDLVTFQHIMVCKHA